MAPPVQPNETPHEGTAVSFQQNQLLLECEALEKVRNSIARNRNQVREESPFSKSNDSVMNDPVIEQMNISVLSSMEQIDISAPSTIEQNVSIDSSSLPKEKGKYRMDNVEALQSSSSQINKPVKQDELCIQKRSPFLTAANQQPNASKSKKKATGANTLSKRPVNPDETVQPLVPAVKRVREIAESSGKKKKAIQIEPPIEYGNRLVDAVIDKPFSKRYALEKSLGSKRQSDSSLKETERQQKARVKEEIISEEERKLIELDDPPYPRYSIQGRKELSRTAQRAVFEFLNNSSTSLKEMRLILLNLKEASIEQSGRLTTEQEEFTKGLIIKLIQQIESYMTFNNKSYGKSLRSRQPDVNASLPVHYYGNIRTLDFSRPDLNHLQVYKIIRHFDSITNTRIKGKAQRYFLSDDRTSTQQILRTFYPAIRDDANATLSKDETKFARKIKLSRREKLIQRKALNENNEKSKISKREKSKATQKFKKEMLAINRQVADEIAEDIDQMADQFATDMHLSKKAKLDPSSSANKPAHLDIDLPASSSAPRLKEFVNAWKPKPAPEEVSAQQFASPSSSVTVVKPVHVAMKDISTNFTNATSRAVDKAKIKNSVSPIVDNTIAKKSASATVKNAKKYASPVKNQKHTRAPIIIINDGPSPIDNDPSPIETPIAKKELFKVTDVPVIIDDNLTSKPTIADTRKSNEDTSLKTQENPMQFQPYKSVLNSFGLSHTASLPEPKSASLCSAESSGGVCKVKNCNFTHFRDYL